MSERPNFAYGIPPAGLQRDFDRKREEEMARELAAIQRFSQGDGGGNPIQDYMRQGASGKMMDANSEALKSALSFAGAAGLAGLGGPFGWLGAPAAAMKAIGHSADSLENYGDAQNYGRAKEMWGKTGLPGRPPTMAEILMQGGGE